MQTVVEVQVPVKDAVEWQVRGEVAHDRTGVIDAALPSGEGVGGDIASPFLELYLAWYGTCLMGAVVVALATLMTLAVRLRRARLSLRARGSEGMSPQAPVRFPSR